MLATTMHPSLPRSLVLVANTNAGTYRRLHRRMHAALAREGLRIVETLDIHDVSRLNDWLSLPLPERPMVVAAGGDGTVGCAANYVANTGTVLGILPVGTHNDVARSLGIRRRIEEAVRLLRGGKVATVDAARFVPQEGDPRFFVHAAAMGINVEFARLATRGSVRKRLGRLTYLVATAAALRHCRPLTCILRFGDREISLCLLHLSIINAPIFGGAVGFRLRGGSIDNRRVDVLAIEHMSLPRLLLAMLPLAVGMHGSAWGVHVHRVPQVEVAAEVRLEVTLDGEIAGQLPATFTLAPEALYVVTPQSFVDIDDEPVSLDAAIRSEVSASAERQEVHRSWGG